MYDVVDTSKCQNNSLCAHRCRVCSAFASNFLPRHLCSSLSLQFPPAAKRSDSGGKRFWKEEREAGAHTLLSPSLSPTLIIEFALLAQGREREGDEEDDEEEGKEVLGKEFSRRGTSYALDFPRCVGVVLPVPWPKEMVCKSSTPRGNDLPCHFLPA